MFLQDLSDQYEENWLPALRADEPIEEGIVSRYEDLFNFGELNQEVESQINVFF